MTLPSGWQPCISEAIEAYCYLPDERVLKIAYIKSKQAYDFPCPPRLFEDFLAAPSKGQFVERVLKPAASALGWSRPKYPRPW